MTTSVGETALPARGRGPAARARAGASAPTPVPPLRIAFVGPPGSGKGTQAALLAERYELEHISTGELLRAITHQDSEAGRIARETMATGELLPDAFVLDLVLARTRGCEATGRGYVLDGFPRTLAQFRSLRRGADEHPMDLVIILRVGRAHLERRLADRGRADDSPATIARRFESHRSDTVPMIRAMRATTPVVTVDGEGSIGSVQQALDEVLRATSQAR
jgi:adenylate kinase